MELSKSDVEVRKFNTIKDRFGISQVEQWLKQIDKESKLSKKVQKEKKYYHNDFSGNMPHSRQSDYRKENVKMKSIFEKNGGNYIRVGDYCIPNLQAPKNKRTNRKIREVA